eukprot:2779963-Amphidinium_carterae.6
MVFSGLVKCSLHSFVRHHEGYPGEGPMLTWPNQRPDRRDTDLRVRVQPETASRYAQRLCVLETWSLEQGFGKVDEILKLTGPQISKLLCAYVQFLYASGSPLQQGFDTLAAVQMARPEISLELRAAWQLQRQWAKLVPVGTRPPMPVFHMLGMAVTAWTLGLKRVAAVLVLMFHCLLRPSKAGGCQRNQLLLPNDIVMGSVEAAIAIPQTKTSDRDARLQAVAIEDETVIDLLVRVFGNDPPHRNLIAGGTKGLQMLFNCVRTTMGLQDTPWTFATLVVEEQWPTLGRAVETLCGYNSGADGNLSAACGTMCRLAWLCCWACASLPVATKALVGQLAALAPSLLGSEDYDPCLQEVQDLRAELPSPLSPLVSCAADPDKIEEFEKVRRVWSKGPCHSINDARSVHRSQHFPGLAVIAKVWDLRASQVNT